MSSGRLFHARIVDGKKGIAKEVGISLKSLTMIRVSKIVR